VSVLARVGHGDNPDLRNQLLENAAEVFQVEIVKECLPATHVQVHVERLAEPVMGWQLPGTSRFHSSNSSLLLPARVRFPDIAESYAGIGFGGRFVAAFFLLSSRGAFSLQVRCSFARDRSSSERSAKVHRL
jgi:hypothetical protein